MREHHRLNEAEACSESGREYCRDTGKDIRPEEDRTKRSRVHAEAEIEPVGGEALHHEAARKGIESEQARQLQDHVTGGADAKDILHGGQAHFSGGRQTGEQEKEQHPESGIENHDRPVALERCQRGVLQPVRQYSATQGTGRGRERAGECVPREHDGSGPGGNDLGECRLLDREKWPHFVATGADDADRPGQDQEQEVARVGEDQAGGDHECGADDQHAPPPDAIGSSGQVEGDDGIPRQRQSQQQAGLGRAEAKAGQIEDQNDGQRAVGEQARHPGQEQQAPVARQGSKHCQRGNASGSPPSTVRMSPVVKRNRSLASKTARSATTSGGMRDAPMTLRRR